MPICHVPRAGPSKWSDGWLAFKSNEVAINWQAAFVYAAARYFRPRMLKARLPDWPQWPSPGANKPADDGTLAAGNDDDPWAWMDGALNAEDRNGTGGGVASGLWLWSFAGASGDAESSWQPLQAYAPTTAALGLVFVALLAAVHSAHSNGDSEQRQWVEWTRERSLPLPLALPRRAQLSRGDMI